MEKDTGVQIEPHPKNSLISIQITDIDLEQKPKGKTPKAKNIKKTVNVTPKAKSIVIKKAKAETKAPKVKPAAIARKAPVKPRKCETKTETQAQKTE